MEIIGETIDKLSDFLTFDRAILPNLITLIIVIIINFLSLKGGAHWVAVIVINLIFMSLLEIMGISSVFNVISIINTIIEEIKDYLSPFYSIVGALYGN